MTRILIVGGTGLTGAHAALFLRAQGHAVTLMSRKAPDADVLQGFNHICADYTDPALTTKPLAAFDQLVFAAGADLRRLPGGADEAAFYRRANVEGIPRFFRLAKEAGIARAVYIGSYYPQVAPQAVERSDYVRSRKLADDAVRALDAPGFTVCSLNAPFIIGHVPGVALPHLDVLVAYARGQLPKLPLVAPAGGVNHISSQSLSEAIAGALARGRGGHAYLVGDENLTWKNYLELFFSAAGNPTDLPVSEDEHPLFPDAILYAGRNATISYEPENGELGYGRGRIRKTVEQLVDARG